MDKKETDEALRQRAISLLTGLNKASQRKLATIAEQYNLSVAEYLTKLVAVTYKELFGTTQLPEKPFQCPCYSEYLAEWQEEKTYVEEHPEECGTDRYGEPKPKKCEIMRYKKISDGSIGNVDDVEFGWKCKEHGTHFSIDGVQEE